MARVSFTYLAVYASSYTNGVAAIHTQILKDTVLADWYKVWPERFLNETNGITQRRWLALCNQELSGLLTKLAGSDAWMTDLKQLKALETKGSPDVLEQFCSIKQTKKQQLADFIAAKEGVTIDPNSIFDIHLFFPTSRTSFLVPASQILLTHLNMDLPSPQENTSALSGFLTGSLLICFVFVLIF